MEFFNLPSLHVLRLCLASFFVLFLPDGFIRCLAHFIIAILLLPLLDREASLEKKKKNALFLHVVVTLYLYAHFILPHSRCR